MFQDDIDSVNSMFCLNKKSLMKIRRNKSNKHMFAILALSAIIVLFPSLFLILNQAKAATTVAYMRLDRMSTGEAISGTICENTGTAGTEAKIVITFPADWTISTTEADWTTSTTNLPSGATAWVTVGATATAADSGTNVVEFSSGDLNTATLYCFNFAGASSTLGAAGSDKTGSFVTLTSGDAAIDTTNFATAVTSSGGDQVTVTATVPATFSFALDSSSIALGTLSTSAVTSGSVVATISTNARNGWLAWLKHTGLTSTLASQTIGTPSTYPTVSDLASTTGLVIDVDATTGAPTIDAGFDGTNITSGGNPSTTFDQIASKNAPAAGNQVTIYARAKVSGTQKAATDYSDTLTITAAGNF